MSCMSCPTYISEMKYSSLSCEITNTDRFILSAFATTRTIVWFLRYDRMILQKKVDDPRPTCMVGILRIVGTV